MFFGKSYESFLTLVLLHCESTVQYVCVELILSGDVIFRAASCEREIQTDIVSRIIPGPACIYIWRAWNVLRHAVLGLKKLNLDFHE